MLHPYSFLRSFTSAFNSGQYCFLSIFGDFFMVSSHLCRGHGCLKTRDSTNCQAATSCTQLRCHKVCQKIFIKFKAEQHTPLPVYLQYRFHSVSQDIGQDLKQCWLRGKFPKQFCIFLYKVPSILLTHKRFQLNYNFTTIKPSVFHTLDYYAH